MAVGKTLKSILAKKGMTIKELAKQSGVAYSTLTSITKRDSKRVNSNVLTAISSALDVSIDDLINCQSQNSSKEENSIDEGKIDLSNIPSMDLLNELRRRWFDGSRKEL